MSIRPSVPPVSASPAGLLDGEEEVVEIDDVTAGDPVAEPGAFRKVWAALLTLMLLVAATYVIPPLAFARPWTPDEPVPFWNLVGREFLGEGVRSDADASAVERARELARAAQAREEAAPVKERTAVRRAGDALPPYIPHPDDEKPGVQAIEDPSGVALQRFYGALARTDARFESALTRVTHYGDSAIGNDGITSSLRRRFQRRFGDGGHGFHLMAPPNASYRHQNLRFSHNGQWKHCFIIKRCRKDGRYGYGGTIFRGPPGAKSVFQTAGPRAPVGQKMSRFELWYAGRPDGGRVEIKADREPPMVVETAADALEDRWTSLELPDGPHKVTVRAAGGGGTLLYGVVMEREGPGVVWDGLAQIGAFTSRMSAFDPEHFRAQLTRRRTDLVVFMFGGNDLGRKITLERYRSDYRQVLDLVRGMPDPPSCLVMAPLDHGMRKGARIVTRPGMEAMVEAQRQVAFEKGCAFWDTFQAMGGPGSMGRWFKSDPKLASGDLSHLSPFGHRALAELFYLALVRGYADYRRQLDAQ